MNADIIANCTLWIGVFPGLTDAMLDYMIETIQAFVRSACTRAPVGRQWMRAASPNAREPLSRSARRGATATSGTRSILLALCLPAIFFYSGYHQLSFNEVLSFKIDDGWCVKGVQSIGAHCFGDYAGVDAGLRAKNFWTPGLPTSTAYPPLAIVPPIAFRVSRPGGRKLGARPRPLPPAARRVVAVFPRSGCPGERGRNTRRCRS